MNAFIVGQRVTPSVAGIKSKVLAHRAGQFGTVTSYSTGSVRVRWADGEQITYGERYLEAA